MVYSMGMATKLLLTVKDLMARWNVSRTTLYKYLGDRGSMKFPKAANRPRRKPMYWHLADIEAYEREQCWR